MMMVIEMPQWSTHPCMPLSTYLPSSFIPSRCWSGFGFRFVGWHFLYSECFDSARRLSLASRFQRFPRFTKAAVHRCHWLHAVAKFTRLIGSVGWL